MAPRASFDDFLDDADLPEEELPSRRFQLPTPRGPAVPRGPASRLAGLTPLSAHLPKQQSYHPRSFAPKPARVAHSTRASGLADAGAPKPPAEQLGFLSVAALASATVVGASSTPQRGRPSHAASGLSFTPPALQQRCEAESPEKLPAWNFKRKTQARFLAKERLLQSESESELAPDDLEDQAMLMALEQVVETSIFAPRASQAAAAMNDCVADSRQSTPSLDVVSFGSVAALSSSTAIVPAESRRDAVTTSLEIVPYTRKASATALVPFKASATALVNPNASGSIVTPGKRIGKKTNFDDLRGTCLEVVSVDAFSAPSASSSSAEGDSWHDRPKRRRIPTLEFWRGEHIVYERLPGSTGLSAKAVVLNTAGEKRERRVQKAIEDREAQLALKDKRRHLAIKDKRRLPALKDKPRSRRKRRCVEDDELP